MFARVNDSGHAGPADRVENDRVTIRQSGRRLPAGSPVAAEPSGGWRWLADEIEAAGLVAKLTDPKEAKQRMRGRNEMRRTRWTLVKGSCIPCGSAQGGLKRRRAAAGRKRGRE